MKKILANKRAGHGHNCADGGFLGFVMKEEIGIVYYERKGVMRSEVDLLSYVL